MVVQSNNATYGGTGQIEQQFAITRARAMEARREVAVATTNSVSGFIDRDGRVVQRTDGVHRRQHGGARCRCAPRSPRRSGSPRGWTVAWPRLAVVAGVLGGAAGPTGPATRRTPAG